MSVLANIGAGLDAFTWDYLGEERVHDLAGEFLETPYEASNPIFDEIDGVVHNSGLFNSWLWFDYFEDGTSIIERYSKAAKGLARDEARLLGQMVQTNYMSFFKIGDFKPGNIELEDLRTGTRYHVREYAMASQIQRGQMVTLRLCQQGGHWEIITPDEAIAPITIDDEKLLEAVMDELPERITIRETPGFTYLQQELGILESEDIPAKRQLPRREAAQNLRLAMEDTGVGRYIAPETVMRLLEDEFEAEETPLAPATGVRVLLGLADPDKPGDAELVMRAATGYWNSLVSKRKLAKAAKGKQASDVHVAPYEPGAWADQANEALAVMTDDGMADAIRLYDELFADMLRQHTVTASVYRVLTNAAVAYLASGDLLFGQHLLGKALQLCPDYDFALRQQSLVDEGFYAANALSALAEDAQLEESLKNMEARLAPPQAKLRKMSDAVLLRQFAEHGVKLDAGLFSEEAARHTTQVKFLDSLGVSDANHDYVYGLLDEARERWAPDVVWADTLHGYCFELDNDVYDTNGWTAAKRKKALQTAQLLAHCLEVAPDAVIRAWMHDTAEYADVRQNLVYAAEEASNKNQDELKLVLQDLCLQALRRTKDPIYSVPGLLAGVAEQTDAEAKKSAEALAKALPLDHTSMQITGDLLPEDRQTVAVCAYELGLRALDRRRSKKLWQYPPYGYATLAEEYEYLGGQLEEAYAATGQAAERERLAAYLREIDADDRLQHNETTDRIEQAHYNLLTQEQREGPIMRYFEWFGTLHIDLTGGDGRQTNLTSPASGGKIGRNDPCPCGKLRPNGLPAKYKNCHGAA